MVDASGGVGVGGGSLDHEVGGLWTSLRLGSIATLGPWEAGGERVVGAPSRPDPADYTLANFGLKSLGFRIRTRVKDPLTRRAGTARA